jgi:hypothetical protein
MKETTLIFYQGFTGFTFEFVLQPNGDDLYKRVGNTVDKYATKNGGKQVSISLD